MKRTNAIVLLIISVVIIIIGGGLYWAQKTGKIAIFGAFEGWPDVTPSDPAYHEIMAVGEATWMEGFPDGDFHADWNATRAQLSVGIVRARGDTVGDITCDQGDPTTWPFTDVDCNHWAFDYIAKSKALGIVEGFPDGSFHPDDPTTRATGVMFIVKAKEWSLDHGETCTLGDPSTYPFPDVDCDHLAYDYIVVAKQERVIFGFPSGNFEPDQDTSRRELALFLYRAWVQPGEEITVSGVVSDSESGDGVAGASVNVVEQVEGTKASDATDSTGAYELRVVATGGAFSVRASASGYQSQTQGIVLDVDKTVNFSLEPVADSEGVISGTVKDADSDSAVSGATVSVLNFESGSQLSDTTSANGAYELRVAATTGTFSVRASATGYDSKTLSASLSGGSATLNFLLSESADDSQDPGETPTLVDGSGGRVSAAATGAVLPVAMVLLGTILALFSLIYLLKTNKPEQSAQA